jgi:hypothetical protein
MDSDSAELIASIANVRSRLGTLAMGLEASLSRQREFADDQDHRAVEPHSGVVVNHRCC